MSSCPLPAAPCAPARGGHRHNFLARRWRSQGIDCLLYLDDCALFAETPEEMTAILHGGTFKGKGYAGIIADCKYLGLPINFEKSVLQPVRVLNWLGYTLDLTNARIHVSKEKVAELLELLQDVPKTVGSFQTARRLAKITGKLMACGLALQPVRLMSRETCALIRCKTKADWDAAVALSPGCVEEMVFWSKELVRWNAFGRKMLPDATLKLKLVHLHRYSSAFPHTRTRTAFPSVT